MLAASRAGGDYLVRMQKDDGSFHYIYDAAKDEIDRRSYNILRHAGAACSLFDLYAATHNRSYLEAAGRAVNFLKSRFKPAAEPESVYVLDDDGKAKLGANGLALLALTKQIELDPDSGDQRHAQQLARHILAMQNADGSFRSYDRIRGDEPEGSASLYYPGEAILGLVSLHSLTPGDSEFIDAARQGATYLIQSQRQMKALPPDAWLIQALEALYKLNPEGEYLTHALLLSETMIREQYRSDAPKGYAGGFTSDDPPRSAVSGARAEGLVAGYRLAEAAGDARAVSLAVALRASARFQLAQQFGPSDASWLPNADRASGGFRESLTSTLIRIDYVQHNISSLLEYAETLTP
jgi:uncharacterized protein YyaL (SSP411 family)